MEARTGREFVNDFFEKLEREESPSRDRKVVETVLKLFRDNKLTNINIYNELEEIRRNAKHGEQPNVCKD